MLSHARNFLDTIKILNTGIAILLCLKLPFLLFLPQLKQCCMALSSFIVLPFLAGNRFVEQAPSKILGLVWALLLYWIWTRYVDKASMQRKIQAYGIAIKSNWVAYLFGFAIALIMMIVSYGTQLLLQTLQIGGLQISWQQLLINIVLAFIFSTAGSVSEELIFRRYLMALFHSRWNIHIACILQALVFGLGHIRSFDNLFSDGLWITVTTGIGGLFLGYLYAFCGNLAAPIAAHTTFHVVGVILSEPIMRVQHNYSYPILYFFRKPNGLEGTLIWLAASIILAIFINRMAKKGS